MRPFPLHPADPDPGDGVFALPYRASEALVHLIPVPFEATVSAGTGTVDGPSAIREASHQVDLLDADFGRPYRVGIWLHPESRTIRRWNRDARQAAQPVIDVLGEIGTSRKLAKLRERVNTIGHNLNQWVEEQVDRLLDDGRIVGLIGGDHSIPYGSIRAHARRWPGMGILHFDAHYDLRAAYEGFTWSHASVMHNVLTHIPEVGRIVPVGIRDFCDEEHDRARTASHRVCAFTDRELRRDQQSGRPFADVAAEIADALPQDVYVSCDIDGLDPAFCPGTGTPVPGGLGFQEAVAILEAVVASGRRMVGFDLVEVAPRGDDDGWNAKIGARLLYKIIGATVRSRTMGLGLR